MQRRTAIATVTLTAAGLGAIALAADLPTKIAPPPTYQSDMEMMARAGTPGMPHRFLGFFVGEWDVAVTLSRPGSSPIQLTATAEFDWVLDGRFLQENIRGEFMGSPVAMLNYLGYDNFKERYTIARLGSNSTAIATALGYQSIDANEIVFFGTVDEPHLNLHDRTTKTIYRSLGKDRFVIEIHDLHIPDPGTKMMSMVYTRK